MLTLNRLQQEQKEWSARNFGPNQEAWQPLLGIVEELGELAEAIEAGDVGGAKDALADTVIFVSGYCSAMGWSLENMSGFAVVQNTLSASPFTLQKHSGRLAHHHLKMAQGIRGDHERHTHKAQIALANIMFALYVLARSFQWDLLEVTEEVWSMVRKRDWTEKQTGCAEV